MSTLGISVPGATGSNQMTAHENLALPVMSAVTELACCWR